MHVATDGPGAAGVASALVAVAIAFGALALWLPSPLRAVSIYLGGAALLLRSGWIHSASPSGMRTDVTTSVPI